MSGVSLTLLKDNILFSLMYIILTPKFIFFSLIIDYSHPCLNVNTTVLLFQIMSQFQWILLLVTPLVHVHHGILIQAYYWMRILLPLSHDKLISFWAPTDVSASALWETLKAYIRGEIISYSGFEKKLQEGKLFRLAQGISQLNNLYAGTLEKLIMPSKNFICLFTFPIKVSLLLTLIAFLKTCLFPKLIGIM